MSWFVIKGWRLSECITETGQQEISSFPWQQEHSSLYIGVHLEMFLFFFTFSSWFFWFQLFVFCSLKVRTKLRLLLGRWWWSNNINARLQLLHMKDCLVAALQAAWVCFGASWTLWFLNCNSIIREQEASRGCSTYMRFTTPAWTWTEKWASTTRLSTWFSNSDTLLG